MSLLQKTLVSDLLASKPNGVIWVKSTDSLAHTLKTLIQHKIHSVPVFDETKNGFVAFVDVIDFAVHLGSTYIENEIIEGSVDRMLQEEEHYKTLQIADESRRNPWYTVNENSILKEAVEILLQHKIHRIAVYDSHSELKWVLSLTDIIDFIYKHMDDHFSKIASQTIGELNLGFKEVITVSAEEKVWKSYMLMNSKGVSGVGITEDNGSIIGHLSAADLRVITFDTTLMDKLKQTVKNFKQEMKMVSVPPTATFREVISTLQQTRMHRVYVIPDGSKTPVGVISQVDVISTIYNTLEG